MLLLCTARYALSVLTFNPYAGMAQFSYRTAFISAAVTYGIVVYKAYRARMRVGKQGGVLSMIADENVQYLGMAVVWLFSRQVALALLPFAVYSIFHVATYTRANVLPTLQPSHSSTQSSSDARPRQTTMAESIGKFVKDYYDSSMTLVAMLEITLLFRLLGSALLFSKGAFMLLALYSVFLRARYSQSPFVQDAFRHLSARADATIAKQSTPPVIRQVWDSTKSLAQKAVEGTDFGRYAGNVGPSGGVKKAQ